MSAYLQASPGNEARFKANLKAIVDHLTKTRSLPLGADDLAGIEYVYRNFHRFGPPSTTSRPSTAGRARRSLRRDHVGDRFFDGPGTDLPRE